MRLSKQGIERIRNGLIRSWQTGGTHHQRVQTQVIDADTLRRRALNDRKGKFVGSFDLYHSTHRSDQFDLFFESELVATGGPRVIAKFMAKITH